MTTARKSIETDATREMVTLLENQRHIKYRKIDITGKPTHELDASFHERMYGALPFDTFITRELHRTTINGEKFVVSRVYMNVRKSIE